MSWECKSVKELRESFVIRAKSCANFSELCREYNISRKTGYKWVERYNNGLPLSDIDKTPHTISNKTSADIEQMTIHGKVLYEQRKEFLAAFAPLFEYYYKWISGDKEQPRVVYESLMNDNLDLASFWRNYNRWC